MKNPDPYSGGLWSGKDATPDVRTVAQNAEARARTATASDVGPPPPKRRRKRAESPPPPPSSAPLPAAFAPRASASTAYASLAWYPTHPTYHTGTYSYAPFPVFWPPPGTTPYPYYPNTQ